MTDLWVILPVGISFLAACVATWGTLRWLPRLGVMDVPNPRSSHDAPTPTLGGLGLIAGAVAGVLCADRMGVPFEAIPPQAFYGSAALMVLFGRDEIRPMGRMMKLLIQCAASGLLIGHGIVLDTVGLPGVGSVSLGTAGAGVTFVWFVGAQNIHNFMDGIDGLVGLHGMIAAAGIALLLAGAAADAAMVCVLVAAACAGFLLWNLPPARIFLGDVGAHFIGLFLAVASVAGERAGVPLWLSAVVMGAFLFDGGYTILRRLLRRENVTVAHRFHLYQRLVRMGATHGQVTAAYGGVTVLLAAFSLAAASSSPWAVLPGAVGAAALVAGTVGVERAWRGEGETS